MHGLGDKTLSRFMHKYTSTYTHKVKMQSPKLIYFGTEGGDKWNDF